MCRNQELVRLASARTHRGLAGSSTSAIVQTWSEGAGLVTLELEESTAELEDALGLELFGWIDVLGRRLSLHLGVQKVRANVLRGNEDISRDAGFHGVGFV